MSKHDAPLCLSHTIDHVACLEELCICGAMNVEICEGVQIFVKYVYQGPDRAMSAAVGLHAPEDEVGEECDVMSQCSTNCNDEDMPSLVADVDLEEMSDFDSEEEGGSCPFQVVNRVIEMHSRGVFHEHLLMARMT